MRNYRFQVICQVGSSRSVYSGSLSAHSESEVRAYINRSYSNIVSIDIWEV